VRGGAGLFVPTNNDLFVICGFDGKEINDVWHFDLEKKQWRKLQSGPGGWLVLGRRIISIVF
jgi:hypothetical protein